MSSIHVANVQIAPYINARASDVANLMDLLKKRWKLKSTKGAITGVKRHMRRRTTAYRSYKMPVQTKLHPTKQMLKKRKIAFEQRCRKHRRRPHILYDLHDMHASQPRMQPRWLETHIWHSKRMKMNKHWGFVLPQHHAQRGISASMKALKDACIIHDISYCRPIQVTGSRQTLIQMLETLTDPALCISELDDFIDGRKELGCVLYQPSTFPQQCIGPVRCMLQYGLTEDAMLWIWTHAAIIETVTAACEASMPNGELCSVGLLQPGLVRFALRGVTSLDCLAEVLDAAFPVNNDCKEVFWAHNKHSEGILSKWPSDYLLGLVVDDPRRIPAAEEIPTYETRKVPLRKWPKTTAAKSCLWNETDRSRLLDLSKQQSDNWFAHTRSLSWKSQAWTTVPTTTAGSSSNHAQSDEHIDCKVLTNSVPVILIRRTGCSSGPGTIREYFAGFDIIGPSGMGRTLWHALVRNGARAVGLDEWHHFHLEAGIPSFPQDFPDTTTGVEFWDSEQEMFVQTEQAKPLKKRVSPSTIEGRISWEKLYPDSVDENYVVVRGSHYTAPFLVHQSPSATARLPEKTICRNERKRGAQCWVAKGHSNLDYQLPSLPFNTMLTVWVVSASKGTIQSGCSLHAPLPEDYQCWNWHGEHLGESTVNADVVRYWPGCEDKSDSRPIIGWVTSGDRSYMYGCSIGIGFCEASQAFNTLCASKAACVDEGARLVVFKNRDSHTYRPCFMDIIG